MQPLSPPTIDDTSWEQTQTRLRAHFLQSAAWAQFQQALGRQIVRAAGSGWSTQAILTPGRGVTYAYAPYGPTLAAGELAAALAPLHPSATDFIRFEPVGETTPTALRHLGARRVADHQPAHTAIINLQVDEATLRSGLSSGHRGAINGADRRGLTFRTSSDPTDAVHFLALIHATASRTGFRPHPDAYFHALLRTLMPLGAAHLCLADHDGATIAAAIGFDYAGTRYYAHAAAGLDARQLQAAAPLVWHMIAGAHAAGLHRFDLWGVAPDNAPATHPWAGFTKFKLSFGATRRNYLGTWELPLRPAKYHLYRLAKRALGARAA